MKNQAHDEKGFTRVELLAVLGVIALLGMLALPALGENGAGAEAVICQSNQRQMVRAYHLYAGDFNEYFAPTSDLGSGPPQIWVGGTQSGNSPDATNYSSLTSTAGNMLAPYMNFNAHLFKCPADTTTALFSGIRIPVVRSISINSAVGTKAPAAGGDGKRPTDGPWLDGAHTHLANTTFRCYARFSEIINPRPSSLFVFLDENPATINDATFGMFGPGIVRSWLDTPAAYHRGAAGLSFADGHAEMHTWTEAALVILPSGGTAPTGNPTDQGWLSARTSARMADGP